MTTFKPMLAAKDCSKIRFPILASVKIDGIRALVKDGKVLSRSLKLIPNLHVQKLFGRPDYEGLDGELVVGAANDPNCMQNTTSGVMSPKGEPDVTFHVFDMHDHIGTFQDRFKAVSYVVPLHEHALVVAHVVCYNQAELDEYEAYALDSGYEGIMVRDPQGLYKFGRSTANEGGLVKVKRFEDDEAECIGFVERMHNDNEATTNELGRTKRSSHKANRRPAGDLGALVCRTKEGVEFQIGTGFSAEQRRQYWDAPLNTIVGRLVKYKCFKACGVLEAPRFPVFIGFRNKEDL